MKERFETVDLGEAKFILGMAIQRNLEAGTILLTQEAYTKAVLAKFGIADVRATATPAEKEPVTTKQGRKDSVAGANYHVPVGYGFGPIHQQGIEAGHLSLGAGAHEEHG